MKERVASSSLTFVGVDRCRSSLSSSSFVRSVSFVVVLVVRRSLSSLRSSQVDDRLIFGRPEETGVDGEADDSHNLLDGSDLAAESMGFGRF
jgi:hypothetical protein